jgi:Flp pilus assembly protein TadD
MLLALPAFGIGWFFITMSVESSFIPIRDVLFEHRLYLPSIGLVTAVTAVCWRLAESRVAADYRVIVKGFAAGSCVVALLLGAATVMRNRVWQSETAVWQDVVRKSPAKGRGFGALGHALQRAGRQDEALRAYQEAVRLVPQDHIARNNLGTIYLALNKPEEAIEQFKAGLGSAPGSVQLYYNLGLAFAKLERFGEAEAAYREALRLDSRNDSLLNNLGIVLYRKGRVEEAAAAFRGSLLINPANAGAASNLKAITAESKVAKAP